MYTSQGFFLEKLLRGVEIEIAVCEGGIHVSEYWAEDGEPVEHFFDIIPLKKADAASIYTTLTDWFKQKGIQPSCRNGI